MGNKVLYLAGKCREGKRSPEGYHLANWRWDLCKYFNYKDDGNEVNEKSDWHVVQNAIEVNGINYDYCGPYLVGCDHGCWHSVAHTWGKGSCGNVEPMQKRLVSLCKSAIWYADLIFAWIDTKDCYGTFAEIGYAAALKKEIWIGTSGINGYPDPDMWFIFELANKIVVKDNPLDAFKILQNPARTSLDDPPTEKQLSYIATLGYQGKKPTTKGEAGKIIGELKPKKLKPASEPKVLCKENYSEPTERQLKYLEILDYHGPQPKTAFIAATLIDELKSKRHSHIIYPYQDEGDISSLLDAISDNGDIDKSVDLTEGD